MISIQKNTQNGVTLELTPTSTGGYYLFEFIWESDTTGYTRYLITPNISPYKDRYDLFEVIEDDNGTTDQVAVNESIFLNPGQYKCNIYASVTPINPANIWVYVAAGPVQTHRMVVFGASATVPPVYDSTWVNPYVPSVYD